MFKTSQLVENLSAAANAPTSMHGPSTRWKNFLEFGEENSNMFSRNGNNYLPIAHCYEKRFWHVDEYPKCSIDSIEWETFLNFSHHNTIRRWRVNSIEVFENILREKRWFRENWEWNVPSRTKRCGRSLFSRQYWATTGAGVMTSSSRTLKEFQRVKTTNIFRTFWD